MKTLSTKELRLKVFGFSTNKKMKEWIINNIPEFVYKPKGKKRKRRTEFSPKEVKIIAEAYGMETEDINKLF